MIGTTLGWKKESEGVEWACVSASYTKGRLSCKWYTVQ